MRRRICIGAVLATMVVGALIGGGTTAAFSAELTATRAAAEQPAAVPTVVAVEIAACCHITIPSNYVYNPNTTYQRSLHDYCTSSPDEFPAPGDNANFRGSCARHDMCYQYGQQSRSGCDNSLYNNLRNECSYEYGSLDPRRGACRSTAAVYYAAVIINTLWNG
jgi:predicted ribosomally synthesized peptide with SipW-like signal peptide